MRTRAAPVALAGAAAALAAAAPPAAAGPPKVEQLVVFRDGSARQHSVKARATTVAVGGRECKVGSATPLAALALTKPPNLKLRDYGSCSDRARDAGGLFVRRIGPDHNRGTNGWVYKVRNRVATAGAGDPTGPFGHGRLEKGARVTWFYCRLSSQTGQCQRTLGVSWATGSEGVVQFHVKQYDDEGSRSPAGGATVIVVRTDGGGDRYSAKTDENGDAQIVLPPGTYRAYAKKAGRVRSFAHVFQAG